MMDRHDFADTVVIDITAEDIANGVREACGECPGALAAMRTFPEHKVTVTYHFVYVDLDNEGDKWIAYKGGEPLNTFTRSFDRGVAVQPTSITLYLQAGLVGPKVDPQIKNGGYSS